MKAHEQAFLKEKQLLARVYAFSFINNSGHRFTGLNLMTLESSYASFSFYLSFLIKGENEERNRRFLSLRFDWWRLLCLRPHHLSVGSLIKKSKTEEPTDR